MNPIHVFIAKVVFALMTKNQQPYIELHTYVKQTTTRKKKREDFENIMQTKKLLLKGNSDLICCLRHEYHCLFIKARVDLTIQLLFM